MTDIDKTLAERGARYGKFADHAVISQGLQDTMRAAPGWSRLAPDQKQALTTIQDKVARMLNGDPDYIDNWHDIIGYAKPVEDRLQAAQAPKAVEPSDSRGEWIDWKGGECPVSADASIEYLMRYSPGAEIRSYYPGKLRWSHLGQSGDIVRYRVISE